MDIGERRQANLLVLAPVGRIDNLTSPDFQARLLAAVSSGTADVVVDFSGVEYISSAGLRALMIASRIKPKDRRLAVVRLNAVVHEIFTISRFSHLVPIFSTIEEVSAAWDAPAQPSAVAPSVNVDPEPSPLRVHFGAPVDRYRRRYANVRCAARYATPCWRLADICSTRRKRLTALSTMRCHSHARHVRRQHQLC